MPKIPYPPVDPGTGAVLGADIGLAGTPWEDLWHIVEGNIHETTEATAIKSIEQNQAWQLQRRLMLADPENLYDPGQFVKALQFEGTYPEAKTPVEYPDVIVWPSALGNRLSLTIYDVTNLMINFGVGEEAVRWPFSAAAKKKGSEET